jgi:hypothetical protein
MTSPTGSLQLQILRVSPQMYIKNPLANAEEASHIRLASVMVGTMVGTALQIRNFTHILGKTFHP